MRNVPHEGLAHKWGSRFLGTHLILSGDPDSLRIVEKSNWTGQGLVFPRAQFAEPASGRS